ncbi:MULTISPECIES: MFS transporter [unclassified Pseudoclavibacter]|uniref:MFS transporter n=1 Tax=unclassified Pseudoclavibacter TaxID=2615177 RepID=UPI000CE72BA6|nr:MULTISPECIES: MFS transporter [unclassified Pseudoclavibacter]MBF4551270.1 MFS transporter [Pseudoclavibacter sp. VKM Ac-2888]PPF33151.1 MFS transporter [Pseudoclavibacter sp. AY1H1]
MTTGTIPTVAATQTPQTQTPPKTAWAAIAAMMATSFVLVVAEFLPPSLLPSMAASLGITEGQAGQTVTVTAFVGFLTAPTIGILVPRLDRRTLLVVLAGAAALSSAVVAVAPGFVLLLIARLLLGAALGAFWAMSIAIAASLSQPKHLGRAIMLVNTGTTVATVAGVPLGSYLGTIMDWRLIFASVAIVTVVVAIALRLALPHVPPTASSGGFRSLVETLRVPGIRVGLTGHILTVLGHFVAFTYIRLAIDRVPGLDGVGVAALLVAFGIGGVIGNFVVGLLVDRHLAVLRFAVPLLIGVSIGIVALAPGQIWLVAVAVTTWGIGFGGWLTTLGTWMGRLVPDRMESGGGLSVAGFQLAITLGAGVGGLLIDLIGVTPALVVASVSAIVGGLIFGSARFPGRTS